jgi:heme/copper-type cytochrome/quinol oxidase subunit 2
VLAVTTTQAHPYHLQVLTFWLALIPVILLVALIVITLVWRNYRRRRHSQHPDLMRNLLRK